MAKRVDDRGGAAWLVAANDLRVCFSEAQAQEGGDLVYRALLQLRLEDALLGPGREQTRPVW